MTFDYLIYQLLIKVGNYYSDNKLLLIIVILKMNYLKMLKQLPCHSLQSNTMKSYTISKVNAKHNF